MASVFPIAAPSAFCVTIEAGVARYRQSDGPHALDPPVSLSSDDGAGAAQAIPACERGIESSASAVVAELDRAHRRREIAPWIPLATVLVLYFAAIGALGARAGPAGVIATVIGTLGLTAGAYVLVRRVDRARGSVSLSYHLDPESLGRFLELQRAIKRLASCHRVWHVPSEGRSYDGKLRYGARLFLRRYRIRPSLTLPPRLTSNLRVPTLYGEHRKFYFFPDGVLVFDESGVRTLSYATLGMHAGEVLCVEDEDVPPDARVVESTWLHATPDGAPDPAIANNRRYPIVLYGELEFAGPGGVRELFHFSQPDAAVQLLAAIESAAWGAPVDSDACDEEHQDDGDAPDDDGGGADDELDGIFDEALRAVVSAGYASLDLIVERFGLPYGRAAALVNRMEEEGYVGPQYRHRPRSVKKAAVRYVALVFGNGDKTAGGARPGGGESNRGSSGASRRRPRARGAREAPKRPAHVVLGVNSGASREEITAKYRELAQMYHPDKVASLAPEFRELAELRMKELNAAYREMLKQA